jgi:pyruvate dehydrogenase E2 component (dihydrolipoamide acetyltransferase)
MAKEVKLPQLGQTMEEGTVVNCLVKEGSEVKKGDVLFEIETDKATLEMESPADGFVKHILVTTGQTLAVGTTMLLLGEKDEEINLAGSFTAETAGSPKQVAERQESSIFDAAPKSAATPARIMASPRAKKLAEEMGVDLATITGTGPGGKITEDDVKA